MDFERAGVPADGGYRELPPNVAFVPCVVCGGILDLAKLGSSSVHICAACRHLFLTPCPN